jgi:outer membrane protein
MRRMIIQLTIVLMLAAGTIHAQTLKIGVVDMERAIVGSSEGKKAEAAFTAKFEVFRKDVETRQKQLEDTQNRLRTQERLLSEQVKADLAKDITRRQTELTRAQEDAQRELDALRGELMRPLAQVAEVVVNTFAREQGFTLIIDSSNPQNQSLIFVNPNADITNEIIKRIDAELAKNPPKKPAGN